jgi:hypothetical protein
MNRDMERLRLGRLVELLKDAPPGALDQAAAAKGTLRERLDAAIAQLSRVPPDLTEPTHEQ